MLLTSVIVTLKNGVFLLKWMVTKKCDINKNVTKMGVIIKGVCYNDFMTYSSTIEILCSRSMNKDTKQNFFNLGSYIKENTL